jgi:hypothetical protein
VQQQQQKKDIRIPLEDRSCKKGRRKAQVLQDQEQTISTICKKYWRNAHLSAVDETVAGDHTIAVVLLLLHAELVAAVGLQHVVLAERSLIQQQRNALSGSELAAGVLGVDSLLATTEQSSLTGLLETVSEGILKRHDGGLQLLGLREASRKDSAGQDTTVVANQIPQHCSRIVD